MELFKLKKYASNKANAIDLINLLKRNLKERNECNEYTKFEIKQIGRLLEGEAYYHEVDEYYRCIGFEVEIESQFDFQEKPQKDVGFYSIWIGKSHKYAPFDFEEGCGSIGKSHRFDNGLGDHVDVMNVIMTVDEVTEVIKNTI